MKIASCCLLLIALTSIAGAADVDKASEEAAIRKVVLDYIEGWFEGSVERMGRALHPQLAKRFLDTDPENQREIFRHLTREQMLEYTAQGGGRQVPAEKRQIAVQVLDIGRTIASARSECVLFTDYIHLTKTGGQWKIINVIWENAGK
jgi:hypothetical protein